MKINYNVGDEVYLKVKITGIRKAPKGDYWVDFEYPHWFNYQRPSLQNDSGVVQASQHLIYGLVDEEEEEKKNEDDCKTNAEILKEINESLDKLLAWD